MPSLNTIAAQQERAVLRAFNDVIADIKNSTIVYEIVRALEVGNVYAVIELLQLDRATFEPFESAIADAYKAGGITGAAQIATVPVAAGTVALRFNVRSSSAEAWLASMSSRLITEVIEEQKTIVRSVLTDALARGDNPRQSALDLIGRINTVTKKREGGFIGLTRQQQQWLTNARADLESLDKNYFNRALRDKRFDKQVMAAMESGRPISSKAVDAAITRMQARALKYRGDVISRTESINALRAGQMESVAQAVAVGEIDSRDVTKSWDATGDARTRPDHLQMEGQEVALDQPFRAPDGSLLMYPGDSSLGASGAQTIQCRCRNNIEINFGAQLRRLEGFS